MKLQGVEAVIQLDFNLEERNLDVYHEGDDDKIESLLKSLKLGAEKQSTSEAEGFEKRDDTDQKKLLWTVLGINFFFFLLEIITGFLSRSMGLVADSLDMLADSFVYAISLLAVGGSVARKKKIATTAGYFQLALAAIGFAEVVRRFITDTPLPDFRTMMIISILALAGNALCLYLFQKQNSKEAHMKASMIFTSNDIIINLGVIVAGLLVHWTSSSYPDLIIGTVVFILVFNGALKILKLGR